MFTHLPELWLAFRGKLDSNGRINECVSKLTLILLHKWNKNNVSDNTYWSSFMLVEYEYISIGLWLRVSVLIYRVQQLLVLQRGYGDSP